VRRERWQMSSRRKEGSPTHRQENLLKGVEKNENGGDCDKKWEIPPGVYPDDKKGRDDMKHPLFFMLRRGT